jgi:hypothetical protein
MRLLLNPDERTPLILRTTDSVVLGPDQVLPPGTPVGLFANADPAHPDVNLCPDLDETAGHTFGASLSAQEKYALKEWLKTQ